MENIISIQHLSKSFTIHSLDKRILACKDVSLDVKEGEFVGITGKSGSGKSTILRCIYRTYLPESGSIFYLSKELGKIDLATATQQEIILLRKKEIGYVSQFFHATPRTTSKDIIIQAFMETGRKESAEEEAEKLLRHFEFDRTLWDSYPKTFSGGEKLRLNVARAMVKRPRLLLLDEPTASLDDASKMRVRELIEQLKEEGTTMLGIFHDIEFMEGLSDKVYRMEQGELL